MRITAITVLAFMLCLAGSGARAQDLGGPHEASPDAPADTPAPDEGEPAPVEPAPAPEPAPYAQPAPQPQPQPYAQPAPEPQPYAQPAPQPTAPPPAAHYEGETNYQYGNEYGADANGNDNAGDGDDGKGFEMPPFSIRLDPFNWVLDGRFGLELEVGIWKFISVELVPVFVSATEPILMDLGSYSDGISQHSNGLGPLAGTSLGVGFWLDGKPFEGYVLRAIFTNYGYTYESRDGAGKIDSVDHTDRQLIGFIGSYARWGFFTIGGGLGLGYELNQDERCTLSRQNVDGVDRIVSGTGGCGKLRLALVRNPLGNRSTEDVHSFLFPAVLIGRFSLGVTFD